MVHARACGHPVLRSVSGQTLALFSKLRGDGVEVFLQPPSFPFVGFQPWFILPTQFLKDFLPDRIFVELALPFELIHPHRQLVSLQLPFRFGFTKFRFAAKAQ